MSLVPLKTNVNATQSLYAPASGGGGGGGGGPNLNVSSMTVNGNGVIVMTNAGGGQTSEILGFADNASPGVSTTALGVHFLGGYTGPQGLTGVWSVLNNDNVNPAYYGDFAAGRFIVAGADSGTTNTLPIIAADTSSGMYLQAPSTINLQTSTVNFQVSSILLNGAPFGGGGATVSTFPDLTVSNSLALGATLNMSADDTNLYKISCVSSSVVLGGLSVGTSGGRNQVYMDTAEAPNFYTSTIKGSTGQISLNPNGSDQIILGGVGAPGDITVTTVGGGNFNVLAGSVSTVTNDIFVNGGTYANIRLAAAGAANALNMRADNGANAKIWAEGPTGVTLSTIGSINGGQILPYSSTPFGTGQPYLEAGYCQDVPYGASTIMFSKPFTTENVCVMLTATSRNISGGANPNISLANAYGISGTGVSSIGFQVDTRDGGVGYNGSFMWMAFPRNQ